LFVLVTAAEKQRSLLCFDVSADGLTVAAGTDLQGDDALILYWDPRNPSAPMRTHSSTHSDDITALHFLHSSSSFSSSSLSKILLSASSDGLVCTSNADKEDEDEAVLHVGNWGCSISQAGWISVSAGAQAWAASDMETFSCWTDEVGLTFSCSLSTHINRQLNSLICYKLRTFVNLQFVIQNDHGSQII
jgi:WD40 repeat protein